jgi:hypothetical protein
MTNGILNDYACPECGYDGPHVLLDQVLAECGNGECAAEFYIDGED